MGRPFWAALFRDVSIRCVRAVGRKTVKIKCLIHEAEEGGFWAEAPSLPRCVVKGKTLEETVSNLREVILCCLGHSLEIIREGTQSQRNDAEEERRKLIYSLPGKYPTVDLDEYMEEKHREAMLEDQ
jgi:predicted RNase H-like HicB family nuclease